jgi:hypothetical protein
VTNTPIPLQEVDLTTKRQRLYHVTWLNRYRLDMQLRPLLRELEEQPGDNSRMGVLFKATFRGAVTLINHYLNFDIREHPSAILLVLLKVVDDRTFESIWRDYSPLVKWVNVDINEDGKTSTALYNGSDAVQSSPPSGSPNVSSRNAWVGQDDVLSDTATESSGQTSDSDTGQQT